MPDYCLDHVHLMSPEPLKTAEFYEKMFGAKRVKMQGDERTSVKLDFNGTTILINQRTGENAVFGLAHFGIRTDNLDKAVAGAKAKDVKFTQEIREAGPGLK